MGWISYHHKNGRIWPADEELPPLAIEDACWLGQELTFEWSICPAHLVARRAELEARIDNLARALKECRAWWKAILKT